MKYVFLFMLTFGPTIFFCAAQNREKGGVEYELANGGSVHLPQRTYDSLVTPIMVNDTFRGNRVNTHKIYDFYCDKRKSLFSNMTGQPVPDFEAKDTEGYPQRAGMYKGRVLILHFWSFWGNSFDNEIPELNRLVATYQKDGLAVLSFTGLPLGEEEKKKLQENPLTFPLVENAYIFADAFFTTKLMRPCLVLVNKHGQMSYLYDGSMLPKNRQDPNPPLNFDFEDKIKELMK